jgi:glycosyltransferase involved in cell wall biosynthesis
LNTTPYYFSIIIPLYNKEQYIEDTLQQVFDQTFSDYEIVIVDDGSTDRSYEIVQAIKDKRIRLIQQKNAGPSSARNRAIREARGKFITFLDADDSWMPEKLERHYEIHDKNPDIFWSCSAYRIVRSGGVQHIRYRNTGVVEDAVDALLEYSLWPWTSAVVIKKEVFTNRRFFFDEKISRSEDIELWYKMAALYPKIGYIGEELAVYDNNVDESLTKTSVENEDLSFLSLTQRIDVELSSISTERKKKLLKVIDRFNKGCIMAVWRDVENFKKYSSQFIEYYDPLFLKMLEKTDSLPQKIKGKVANISRRIRNSKLN